MNYDKVHYRKKYSKLIPTFARYPRPRMPKGHVTTITGNFTSYTDGDPVRLNLRAQQTRRNRKIKVTLPPTPWDTKSTPDEKGE